LQDGIATHMQSVGNQRLIKINNLNTLTTLLWHKVEDKVFRFCDKGGQNQLKQKSEKIYNPNQHDFARMAEPSTMQGVGKQLKLIYIFQNLK
jgi:hypothetical protein